MRKQLHFWPEHLKERADLLTLVQDHKPGYGIRDYDLSRVNHAIGGYNSLQRIFIGASIIDFPAEVLDALNPMEILAAYAGVYRTRYNNFVQFPNGVRKVIYHGGPSSLETVVDDLRSAIHDGFSQPGIGGKTNHKHPYNVFPVWNWSLKRLNELEQETKNKLVSVMNPPELIEGPDEAVLRSQSPRTLIVGIHNLLYDHFSANQ